MSVVIKIRLVLPANLIHKYTNANEEPNKDSVDWLVHVEDKHCSSLKVQKQKKTKG